MNVLFYLSAIVATVATAMVLTRVVAVHALLYLVVSLLAVALVLFSLGAPFVAALEVIIYAGAIMVLFVFVIMLLNLSPEAARRQQHWWTAAAWVGPGILAAVLLVELIYILVAGPGQPLSGQPIEPRQVGIAMFGPYLLGVELASLVLLAGLIGAYHLGQRPAALPGEDTRFDAKEGAPGVSDQVSSGKPSF